MSRPRFSIVVPTRERAATLHYCLRTCLAQDYDDYEVVVCDNHSSPATRQVVEELSSPRIKYLRAPRPLAMSANWELAVGQAAGEYVTVLGDDDGLLGHALRELDRQLLTSGARALRWTGAYYSWPDHALPGQGNYLRVPLGRQVEVMNGPAVIREVVQFRRCYSALPMLYNSVIHRDLLAELRARTGRVFANHCPDVYSGFALGYVAGEYLSSQAPMSVAGQSGRSTGVAHLFLRGRSPLDSEFRALNAEAGFPFHPHVPDLPIFPTAPVADSFLWAKHGLFAGDDSLALDRRVLVEHYLAGIRAETPEEWAECLRLIRASLSDRDDLLAWFDATCAERPPRSAPPFSVRTSAERFDGDFLHLDADEFGASDVLGAVELCEKVLGYRARGIADGLPSHSSLRAELATLRGELAEARARLDEVGKGEAGRASLWRRLAQRIWPLSRLHGPSGRSAARRAG
jgi:hypothetical protein